MARNEEKHFARLNRLYLKKEHEEFAKKHPKRPKLYELHTSADLRKWLPSIKQEMDICLRQSQVACYPEHKVAEYRNKADYLAREYKKFVAKIRQLSPPPPETENEDDYSDNIFLKHIRPYRSLNNESLKENQSSHPNFTIVMPILDRFKPKLSCPPLENETFPADENSSNKNASSSAKTSQEPFSKTSDHGPLTSLPIANSISIQPPSPSLLDQPSHSPKEVKNNISFQTSSLRSEVKSDQCMFNPLHLDYSSSSSDSDT